MDNNNELSELMEQYERKQEIMLNDALDSSVHAERNKSGNKYRRPIVIMGKPNDRTKWKSRITELNKIEKEITTGWGDLFNERSALFNPRAKFFKDVVHVSIFESTATDSRKVKANTLFKKAQREYGRVLREQEAFNKFFSTIKNENRLIKTLEDKGDNKTASEKKRLKDKYSIVFDMRMREKDEYPKGQESTQDDLSKRVRGCLRDIKFFEKNINEVFRLRTEGYAELYASITFKNRSYENTKIPALGLYLEPHNDNDGIAIKYPHETTVICSKNKLNIYDEIKPINTHFDINGKLYFEKECELLREKYKKERAENKYKMRRKGDDPVV